MALPGDGNMGQGRNPLDAELALNDDDGLPWLESGDEDYDEGQVDTSRIIIFAAILLALLAVTIGVVWWASNRNSNPEIVADGSTIRAPETPYKVKPKDPGGKEYAGTGNVAPGVGEGKVSEGRLAVPDPAPAPSVSTKTVEDEPVQASGVAVQVGAYGSHARAQEGWATLIRQTTALNGVRHRVVQGQADIGTVFRLQAIAGDLDSARDLCDRLKADGLACQVKR